MNNDRTPSEIDLDFVRYASDIKQSKSLKMFIDSGREKRERSKKSTKSNRSNSPMSDRGPQSNGELSDSSSSSQKRNRYREIGTGLERLGPEGCERPVITSVCTGSVLRTQSPSDLSSASSTDGNPQELGFVREKMQDALQRLRDLEEQVKTIPKLQV